MNGPETEIADLLDRYRAAANESDADDDEQLLALSVQIAEKLHAIDGGEFLRLCEARESLRQDRQRATTTEDRARLHRKYRDACRKVGAYLQTFRNG